MADHQEGLVPAQNLTHEEFVARLRSTLSNDAPQEPVAAEREDLPQGSARVFFKAPPTGERQGD